MSFKPTSYLLGIISISLFLLIVLPSCKKEIKQGDSSNSLNSKSSAEYLVFDSKEKMRQCITDLVIDNLEDPLKVLNKYQVPENFKSYQTSKHSGKNVQTEQGEKALTEWNEDLVPDPYFASILNDKLEVQIENTIIKVTKYGTFMCMPNKLPRVYEIIKELDNNNQSIINKINASAQTEGFERPSRVHQVDPGVVIFQRPSRVIPTNPSDPEEDDNKYVRPSRNIGQSSNEENVVEPLPQYTYDEFSTYDYDAKTWAGQLIQDAFGRTKPHFNYFDSEHRVKANFYNVNFGVYASVGLNVKMQTKGWTGIWRKLETDELRLGWDGLVIKFKIPNMPQPKNPQIDFGKIKLGSIDIPIETISIAGKDLTEDIKSAINGQMEGQFRNALKKIWEFAYKAIAPEQVSVEKKYIKGFKAVYNDEVVLTLGRYEESASNTNAITKTFDWNVGITIKWNPKGEAVNLKDFSMAPSASEYEIKSASVYGAAKYYGTWKGVRVDKK